MELERIFPVKRNPGRNRGDYVWFMKSLAPGEWKPVLWDATYHKYNDRLDGLHIRFKCSCNHEGWADLFAAEQDGVVCRHCCREHILKWPGRPFSPPELHQMMQGLKHL